MSQETTVHDELCGKQIWGPSRPCNCEERRKMREARQPKVRPPYYPHACCDKAEPIPCVCAWAYTCPTHGDTHIGTHD